MPRCGGGDAAAPARSSGGSDKRSPRHRRRAQLDSYADRVGQRYPNAYLIGEETTEEAIQLAAAGGRTARIAAGEATSDPVAWENDLANALLDDPTLPLALEATRMPRPPIPVPPPLGSDIWVRAMTAASSTSERGPVESALEPDGVLPVTLQVEPSTAAWILERARFRGWRMLAAVEEQLFQHPDWHDHSEFVATRYRVVELRHAEDEETFDMPPVTLGDIRVWQTEVEQSDGVPLPGRTVPLFGLDFALAGTGDGRAGLGVQSPLLAPTPRLISVLRLHPGEPFTLHDSRGCGLVLVTWRAAYDTSEYYLARPQLVGSAVLARPDLLERLQPPAGHRLILRDFAVLTHKLQHARSSDS